LTKPIHQPEGAAPGGLSAGARIEGMGEHALAGANPTVGNRACELARANGHPGFICFEYLRDGTEYPCTYICTLLIAA
jgi:hypothetical protein